MSSDPPDDGNKWDVGDPTIEWYQKTYEGDVLRPDLAVPITDFEQGGPEGGTVAHAEGATVSWTINLSLQVNIPIADAFFNGINATFGGQYSQSYTETNTYTETIPANQSWRIIYVPMHHRTIGTAKITQRWLEPIGDNVADSGTRVVADPITIDVSFPISGGQYQLQPRDVVVYDDSQYQGYSQQLGVGQYDWGQIHNDTISSLRVFPGMSATLYSDTHFQGYSKTFTQDTPYVGDDMNDQTSSIIVK